MLSRKSKYGLKALLLLANNAGDQPVLIADLAARDAMPRKFLEAILLDLKRHGLVESRKGKGGGYFLRRRPDSITVGEVIRILEGPLALVPVRQPDRVHEMRRVRRRTHVWRPAGDERRA